MRKIVLGWIILGLLSYILIMISVHILILFIAWGFLVHLIKHFQAVLK